MTPLWKRIVTYTPLTLLIIGVGDPEILDAATPSTTEVVEGSTYDLPSHFSLDNLLEGSVVSIPRNVSRALLDTLIVRPNLSALISPRAMAE